MGLSVSENASRWMLKKGYAVNDATYIKQYEGMTDPCDVLGGRLTAIKLSNACASSELPTVCSPSCGVNRSLVQRTSLTTRSSNGWGGLREAC